LSGVTVTVAIPTFNGGQYLGQAIESALSNITDDLRGRVQVLVSDNCSSDTTSAIAERYAALYPDIVLYTRHEKNIGFDRNVQSVFENAPGEYVYVLGDDDVLAAGALERVMRVLDEEGDLSVVLGRVDFLDITSGARIDGTTYLRDKRCEDGDTFFQETKWGTAVVSSLTIRRAAWLEHDLEKYVGSQWIHTAAVMRILSRGDSSYVLRDSLATVRVGNPRWGANFGNQMNVGIEHLRLMSELPELGYSPATLAYYLEDRYRTSRQDILAHRARHARDNISTAILMARLFRGRPGFWFVDLPLLLMPDWILRMGRCGGRITRAARGRLMRIGAGGKHPTSAS
jgi:glycosyltransferase involved in cell wall biosynthesis